MNQKQSSRKLIMNQGQAIRKFIRKQPDIVLHVNTTVNTVLQPTQTGRIEIKKSPRGRYQAVDATLPSPLASFN